MARTLEIAAVLGTNNITEIVKDGDILAVNGITGEVIINPTDEQAAEFKAAGEAYAKQKKAEWALLKDAKTVTADGKHFELAANIGTQKTLKVSMTTVLKLLVFTVQSSCTWILKTSQQKTSSTKLTRLYLKE